MVKAPKTRRKREPRETHERQEPEVLEPAPLRPRYSLTHRGGEIERHGDPKLAELLASALVASEDAPDDELTHGFHSHPARMHPALPAKLIPELSERDSIILDPFCGSGTVLVEALAHGRRAAGVDLDPLALRIAETRCALRDPASRGRFGRTLHAIALASEDRVRMREKVEVPISRAERAYYDPHVMLELSGLYAEISRVADEADRRALELLFSAIVVKFSRQRADTNEELVKKRIRKGLVTEFFERKGEELLLRWAALYEAVPEGTDPVRLWMGDARRLPDLLGRRFSASLVFTSPPYGGTYDYARHHARRHAWLGLDTSGLRAHEIGARRNLSGQAGARKRWDDELHAVLSAIEGVLSRDGKVLFFVGDAEVARTRVAADEQLLRLAPELGLSLLAGASQPRPDFHGGVPRREHLILMARTR